MATSPTRVRAVDLFCGAGGLSRGLLDAGIDVVAGIDLDPACRYPFETNIGSVFIQKDVAALTAQELESLWGIGHPRLLAGCAPCQPFSSHRRGADTKGEDSWNLLSHFGRLVRETSPEFVTMENVPRLGSLDVFKGFLEELRSLDYSVDYGTLFGPDFGLPQERRRLVLVASRLGGVELPKGTFAPDSYATVQQTIGHLPTLESGESDPTDPLHTARRMTPLNLARMKASVPGGTWRDWPTELLAECHKKSTGSSFQAFYGRMKGDRPAPTITTQAYSFGTGRFGHPSQDRSLTLREAAMLQGFPREYEFVPGGERPSMQAVGRLIGNAVPPVFGAAVGNALLSSITQAPGLPTSPTPSPKGSMA